MSTFEMLERTIDAQKKRGPLTQAYIDATLRKMDVFLMAGRITEDEYNTLLAMLQA